MQKILEQYIEEIPVRFHCMINKDNIGKRMSLLVKRGEKVHEKNGLNYNGNSMKGESVIIIENKELFDLEIKKIKIYFDDGLVLV